MDRTSQSIRPEGPNSGTQNWRVLAFLHWEVDAEVLSAHLPAGLTLDTFEGRAFLGIVPFAMEAVRPSWSPVGFDFLETNVRTYVHRDGRDPAVFFFSLEAASWLAVKAARVGWALPYHHARMELAQIDDRVAYSSIRRSNGAMIQVEWEIGAARGPSVPGTLEHFLLERYLLYSVKAGKLLKGQVHHSPYPVHSARVLSCEQSLLCAAGLPGTGPPDLVHYSPGVDVEVFALRPC